MRGRRGLSAECGTLDEDRKTMDFVNDRDMEYMQMALEHIRKNSIG